MPFFQNVRRAPISECGEKRVFVTTKSGIKIWLDPYSDDASGPVCLDIPRGRRFMRKLFARYKVLKEERKFVDITRVRTMVKYVANIKEQHGEKLAKAVRLLAAQLMNGFEVRALDQGSVYDQLSLLGVNLRIDGRNITITDLKGTFSFTDDYYYTATKFALLPLLKKYNLSLTFVDQRDRNSVEKILKDKSDIAMVEFFAGGGYLKHPLTKFWGGKGLGLVRKVEFNPNIIQVGRGVKLIKTRKLATLNWRMAGSKSDWLDIFSKVLSHDFDKKKTEKLKSLMDRNDFKRVRDRLRRFGAFEILYPKRIMCEYIYDALFVEIGYDPEQWMSFVIRGINNLLRYQGDRFEQLVCAHDDIVSNSTSSSDRFYAPFKKKIC